MASKSWLSIAFFVALAVARSCPLSRQPRGAGRVTSYYVHASRAHRGTLATTKTEWRSCAHVGEYMDRSLTLRVISRVSLTQRPATKRGCTINIQREFITWFWTGVVIILMNDFALRLRGKAVSPFNVAHELFAGRSKIKLLHLTVWSE